MANSVLVLGESGTGKSTALRNFDFKSTFIINVLGKNLPFRGYKKHYKSITGWDDKINNYFVSDDWSRIVKCIKMVNDERQDITTLIIDDLQYVMSFEFLRRVSEKTYDKYSEMAVHFMAIINACNSARDDLFCCLLTHNEVDNQGYSKLKTIGRLLEEKIKIEGVFTAILHSCVTPDGYKFLTNHDGMRLAKTPMGMFDQLYIDNDLKLVRDSLIEYFNDGE